MERKLKLLTVFSQIFKHFTGIKQTWMLVLITCLIAPNLLLQEVLFAFESFTCWSSATQSIFWNLYFFFYWFWLKIWSNRATACSLSTPILDNLRSGLVIVVVRLVNGVDGQNFVRSVAGWKSAAISGSQKSFELLMVKLWPSDQNFCQRQVLTLKFLTLKQRPGWLWK